MCITFEKNVPKFIDRTYEVRESSKWVITVQQNTGLSLIQVLNNKQLIGLYRKYHNIP